MATHISILAWRIPWMEEPGGLQSTGSKESGTTELLHFHLTLGMPLVMMKTWMSKCEQRARHEKVKLKRAHVPLFFSEEIHRQADSQSYYVVSTYAHLQTPSFTQSHTI